MSEVRDVNKLSDMEIDEVSLVDQPANDHAKVVLSKRDEDGEEVSKDSPDASSSSVMGDTDDEEEEMEPPDPNQGGDANRGFFKSLVDKVLGDSKTDPGSVGNIPDDVSKIGQGPQIPFGQQQQGQPAPGIQAGGPQGMQAFPAQPQQPQPQQPQQPMPGMQPGQQQMPGQMQQGPPIPDEVVQYIQQLEQALAQAQGTDQSQQQPSQGSQGSSGQEAGVNKSHEALSEDESEFLSELAKSLEDEDQREAIAKAREAVSKAEQRAQHAEEIAKAERDHRLTEEYVAKARAYTNLPVEPQEFGGVLKRLHESMAEEDVATIEKALSTANETAGRIFAFDEIGKSGTGENEPVSKIDQEARTLIEKSGNEMSIEQAREQVMATNPGLYEEYLNEVGS